MEEAVHPLLYVLAYGCNFVAKGTPADIPGLTALIEEVDRRFNRDPVSMRSRRDARRA